MTVRVARLYEALATGAQCLGSQEVWDADSVTTARKAIRGCAGCPVWWECEQLRAELQPTAGVWAGIDCDDARRRAGRTVT